MILKEIEVAGFRGIPTRVRISLQPERGKQPESLILSGDNGTGKSSIVDAIEFALQARVGRSKLLGDTSSASLMSFSTASTCMVQAGFSDGSLLKREVLKSADEYFLSNYSPHPLFAVSPFVLRRSDVLRFHETPEDQRQLIFFDFFKTPTEAWGNSPKEEFDVLIKSRIQLRLYKQKLRQRLAEILHWDTDVVPQEKKQLIEFIRSHFYRGMSQKQWKQSLYKGLVRALPLSTEVLITDLVKTTEDLASTNSKIKRYRNFRFGSTALPVIKKILSHIAGEVTESFSLLSNAKFVKNVMITHSEVTDVSLSVKLLLNNSTVCDPRQILSEANLDLLAFLLYLAAMKESARHGQAKLLVLDDVFQSVDSTIRLSVIDFILSNMHDWQLIVTAHDRMWKEQVRDLFQRHGRPFVEREIVRWDFDLGPKFRDGGQDMEKLLVDLLERGDPVPICSYAGWVLEAICNRLSWTIPVSVPRRKEDKYTLGDLWPPVFKFLKRTNRSSEASEIEKWNHLRNLVGAHYNTWAIILADQEAQSFGESVLALLKSVRCSICGGWLEVQNQRSDSFVCRCGLIILSKT